MARVYNFNPGPCTLPLSALEKCQAEFLDFHGTGMSIVEASHPFKRL
jgi:phosphoserine aminotransferase